jgi:hypothetical protein
VGQGEEEASMKIFGQRDDVAGVDDFVAEIALAKRERRRRLAGTPGSFCGRRFTHPRQPTQFDERGYLVVETCKCTLLSDHDDGCVCGHDIERRVYRVDADGREHYATRPLGGHDECSDTRPAKP